MAFSAAALYDLLEELPRPECYWVAYSGGRDSHVLLHAMAGLSDQLTTPLRAIHINHGLQSAADAWEAHCIATCKDLDIPLETVRLALSPIKGESLEALAREGRYRAISALIKEGELLLTAHHQDDQAETLLLQLLRGAGPAGLGSMPRVDTFGDGYRARPLLGFQRSELEAYAIEQQLSWVEDGSNLDLSFDRNYLRSEVFPLLQARWPGVARTLSRSAGHCAESHELIEAQATEDLKTVLGSKAGTLEIPRLLAFPMARIRALLRHWITHSGFFLPSTAKLNRIINEVINAGEDRSPLLQWSGAEVRRYRKQLYLMTPLVEVDAADVVVLEPDMRWRLSPGMGEFQLLAGEGGVDPRLLGGAKLQIRYHPLDGRLHIQGRAHSMSFKNFYQERGIPPWMRGRLPLLYAGEQLVAVADFCICHPFGISKSGSGVLPNWKLEAQC
ncbi:MAG: tRNA lysidine(34) synthetase TilS [Candidatus Sedimenticola sp. (ex Thyasira tokunagai)]